MKPYLIAIILAIAAIVCVSIHEHFENERNSAHTQAINGIRWSR